jgi:hypothetical protein
MERTMSKFFLLAALAAMVSACTHVAPYERGRLAEPTMLTSADLGSAAAGHVRAVHEGAAGGGSIAESGCGCN